MPYYPNGDMRRDVRWRGPSRRDDWARDNWAKDNWAREVWGTDERDDRVPYPSIGALYGPSPLIGEALYPHPRYRDYDARDYDDYRRDDPWRGGGYRYGRGRDDDPRERGDRRAFLERATDEVASWFGDEDAERRRERDKHRGKGPRGYKRSDARISEDVHDRLSDDPYLDATNIAVEVNDREVTLSGLVDHRHDKRRAEDCAESVSGVTHVQNNLRVRPHPVPAQSDVA